MSKKQQKNKEWKPDIVYDQEEKKLLKLDLGCGLKKQPDHIGIDSIAFPGVDHKLDLATKRLPFNDNTIDEIYASHFVEHLNTVGRCHLLNEVYRVLKVGAKFSMIVPYWASSRAYGDPTHQWPPIGEMWFFYLSRKWRLEDGNAPHTDISNWSQGYNCDFEVTWGYSLHQHLNSRNQEYVQHALSFWKEAGQDIQATLIKK